MYNVAIFGFQCCHLCGYEARRKFAEKLLRRWEWGKFFERQKIFHVPCFRQRAQLIRWQCPSNVNKLLHIHCTRRSRASVCLRWCQLNWGGGEDARYRSSSNFISWIFRTRLKNCLQKVKLNWWWGEGCKSVFQIDEKNFREIKLVFFSEFRFDDFIVFRSGLYSDSTEII